MTSSLYLHAYHRIRFYIGMLSIALVVLLIYDQQQIIYVLDLSRQLLELVSLAYRNLQTKMLAFSQKRFHSNSILCFDLQEKSNYFKLISLNSSLVIFLYFLSSYTNRYSYGLVIDLVHLLDLHDLSTFELAHIPNNLMLKLEEHLHLKRAHFISLQKCLLFILDYSISFLCQSSSMKHLSSSCEFFPFCLLQTQDQVAHSN